MNAERKSESERRNHYRVDTRAFLRLRPARAQDAQDAGPDPVAAFEELASAASRYRKDAAPAARAFVDAVEKTVAALVASASAGPGESGWSARASRGVNLSAGGVGFHWERPLDVGSKVDLELALQDEGSNVPFRLLGAVVRRSAWDGGAFGIGLEFGDLPPTTQQRLIRAIFDLQRVALRNAARKE
jgi:hypothetical protein